MVRSGDALSAAALIGALSVCVFFLALIAPFPVLCDEQKVTLVLDLPEGRTFTYRTSLQDEINWGGVDVVMTQSAEVEVSLDSKTDEGDIRILFNFLKLKASRIIDADLQSVNPPIDLNGKKVFAVVSPAGDMKKVEAGGYIPGLKKESDLEQYIEQWFIMLPGEPVGKGSTWMKEVLEKGKEEGDEPELEGTVEYTLKKFEKKNDIDVAAIEAKVNLKVARMTRGGPMRGVVEGKGKFKVAIDGGYLVECKISVDVKGKVTSEDPLTGGEKESNMAVTQNIEIKLRK